MSAKAFKGHKRPKIRQLDIFTDFSPLLPVRPYVCFTHQFAHNLAKSVLDALNSHLAILVLHKLRWCNDTVVIG